VLYQKKGETVLHRAGIHLKKHCRRSAYPPACQGALRPPELQCRPARLRKAGFGGRGRPTCPLRLTPSSTYVDGIQITRSGNPPKE
jgi:hypothetical protein